MHKRKRTLEGRVAKAPKPATFPRKDIPVEVEPGDSEKTKFRKIAALALSPEYSALKVVASAERKDGVGDQLDTPALLDELRVQAKAVHGGDLKLAEAMLMNQAVALQSLFGRLTVRGMGCDQVPGFEVNLRMALRAQNQCRATLETLAALRNPPIIYAKQANISNGLQQVNNGIPSQAGENEIQQSKLLGGDHGERLDDRSAGAAIGADSHLAAVGEVHGAEVVGG